MASKHTLATMYGIGLIKKAPGTMGSLAAAIIAYPIVSLPFSMILLFGGVFFFTVHGTRSSTRYMALHDCGHDPSEIVVDELVGQWLTYVVAFVAFRALECGPVGTCPAHFLDMFSNLPLALFLGFLSFRLFDILKPWPISLADRKVKGGFGVMFDDLLAAIPAGILLAYGYPFVAGLLA